MFGSIGFTEIIIIAGIALIFLGPERFPEVAKMAARFVRDVRGYLQEAQNEISKELRPVTDELKKISKTDTEAYFNKLADLADKDEDLAIAPEPDPKDWYDLNNPANRENIATPATPEGVIPFDPLVRAAHGPGDPVQAATPERLDG